MPEPAPASLQPRHACPFCGLGCDDLSPKRSNGQIVLDTAGCEIAKAGFAAALGPGALQPRVHGNTRTLQEALSASAGYLRRSRLPLFTGLSGDLMDIRGALRLAERAGGAIDHRNGDALMDNLSVLEASGWMTTSLGEARNRADLLVLVGEGIFERFPRLADRLCRPAERLNAEQPPELILIGPDAATAIGPEATGIDLPTERLRDFVGVVRARLAGRPLAADTYPEASWLARRLATASYPVIAFATSTLNSAHRDLIVNTLGSLVRELNATGRAALLPLGGGDGETSAQQASAWHTGFGARGAFGTGVPVYAPRSGAARRLLADGEADLLVWISTLSNAPPPITDVPTLALGHPAMHFEQEPDVFIPLAVPGVHRHGAVHRGDGLALLPLNALTDSSLPSSAEVCASLIGLLCQEQPPC